LHALEEYQRRAEAYEHRPFVAVAMEWQRIGMPILELEQILTRLRLGPETGHLLPAIHGNGQRCSALISLVEWLVSARGTTVGWGQVADGRWGLTPPVDKLPDVSRIIRPFRLVVEDLSSACESNPDESKTPGQSPNSCGEVIQESDSRRDSEHSPAKKTKGKQVNERMKELLLKDGSRLEWSVEQWAGKLKCSKSTVAGTETWQKILNARALREADRLQATNSPKTDRRRFRKKPSSDD
jgi:hypothetical protein